ncbi:Maltokinase [Corynebacterium glaucum]|uniref:Maltokinase n=1 Tax=Corynebacterium glaucum TaxID=187491 RepID=A0A1Q2HYD0_9CORY|nr:trehalose synthase [Corynebacterium glaucum]AQQ15852.1 Maltokinase [Corynebacterium glaucum]
MIDITAERFYGAKSEKVTHQDVLRRQPLGQYQWLLMQLNDDLYQVLSNGERDVLATDAGASAYVEHMEALGEVHGELSKAPAAPLGAEQSNTSLIVGDTIVKVFRKLEDGLNPDVEILSQISNPHVARVTGYITLAGRTLAMQQEKIDGTDGFELATQGFDPQAAHDLGAAIRSVHVSLADTFGTTTADAQHLRDTLHANLDSYLRRAPILREFEESIRKLYDATLDSATVSIQRVHGDLHLGQTLKSGEHWYLIDFEGEPARPLAERQRPDHVMRDVAGMIRSFGYARAVGDLDAEWERQCVDKLKLGYGQTDRVLDAYIADKAAYEVVYEANNRPDWVDIPLDALRSIL